MDGVSDQPKAPIGTREHNNSKEAQAPLERVIPKFERFNGVDLFSFNGHIFENYHKYVIAMKDHRCYMKNTYKI
jgi:hypothetical protein